MKINLTGLGFDVTPALKAITEKKLTRITRHFDKIGSINITFSVVKLMQVAEASLQIKGTQINAKAESNDMYKTVDNLMDKLDKQVLKHKEKSETYR